VKVFQVVEATAKTGKDKDSTTIMVIDPRNGNKVSLTEFQSRAQQQGYNVVDYASSQHSPQAKAGRVKDWVTKDGNTIAEKQLEARLGASNVKDQPNPKRQNIPPSAVISNQTSSFFNKIGFEPSDTDEMIEASNLMAIAVNDMIDDLETRKPSRIESIEPYLARSFVTVRSGIAPDLFKVGEGDKVKLMPPEKIVALDNLVKETSSRLNDGKPDQNTTKAIYQEMYRAWNSNPDLRKTYKASSNESAFYMFMKDKLQESLK